MEETHMNSQIVKVVTRMRCGAMGSGSEYEIG